MCLVLGALGFASPDPHTILILSSFNGLLPDAEKMCEAFVNYSVYRYKGQNPHSGRSHSSGRVRYTKHSYHDYDCVVVHAGTCSVQT